MKNEKKWRKRFERIREGERRMNKRKRERVKLSEK